MGCTCAFLSLVSASRLFITIAIVTYSFCLSVLRMFLFLGGEGNRAHHLFPHKEKQWSRAGAIPRWHAQREKKIPHFRETDKIKHAEEDPLSLGWLPKHNISPIYCFSHMMPPDIGRQRRETTTLTYDSRIWLKVRRLLKWLCARPLKEYSKLF